MIHEEKKITISMSPEVYRDLRNIAIIRYMTGAMANSVGDEFLVKLLRVMDKGEQEFVFRYKDPNYDASLPDGKGISMKKDNTDGQTQGDPVKVEIEEVSRPETDCCPLPGRSGEASGAVA
jgi:hypothetical protein